MPRRSATPTPAGPERRRPVEVGARLGRAGVLALGLATVAGPAWPASTELVSVAAAGGAGNGDSYTFRPEVSDDGRFVAFRSDASNLVAGDTNGLQDVFVRDRRGGRTERVSVGVGVGGVLAEEGGTQPSTSGDGRYVAFESNTRLVPDDADALGDVFVRDRQAGTTELVSLKKGGSGGPAISADGRLVAYDRQPIDRDVPADILVRNRGAGSTALISVGPGGEANAGSTYISTLARGRYVAFQSEASNLVPGDTNGEVGVFVHDRAAGVASRVSVGAGGVQANGQSGLPSISADGRHVAFVSDTTNLAAGDGNGLPDVYLCTR